MKTSVVSATSRKHRRAHHLSATALAGAGALGAWPAGLVALPLAFAPTGAGAATITVGTNCVLPPASLPNMVCFATSLLASPGKSKDVIAFEGGALTLDGTGLTYAQQVALGTTPTNILNQYSNDTTFTGVVSGSGNIEIANSKSGGSVTLNNNKNTYTGSTTVDSGATLKLGAKNAIASSSTLADNGAVDISGAGGNVTITDLSGNGTVALGSNTLLLSGAASLFAGGISGAGGLTVSGGTETLSGNNTYTGITTIGSNGTLSIGGAGSIASSSTVTDNGVFDIHGANSDVTIRALGGSGTVNLGSNSVILSNPSTTFGGGINGTGGVTVAAGVQTFTGNNTYSGTTTIKSGAIVLLSKAGSIASSSVADDGLLDISGTKGTSIVSLSGAGTVNLGTKDLTLSNASGIFSGQLVGSGKASGLMILAGTETLMNNNPFTGTTTVSAGATLSGIGSIGGALVSSGTIKPFNPSASSPNTFTIGGNYTQTATGSLNIAIGGTKAGTYGNLNAMSGTVTLAGALDVDPIDGFAFPQGDTSYDILDYKVGKNSVSGDFSIVSYNGSACTGDGLDKWICGVGLTFTESFTASSLDLLVSQAPEPGTLAIIASGLLGLLGLRRRWTKCPD
jgi:fibronectin-binding autotransporter adhesin